MPSTRLYRISLEKLNSDEHRAFITRLAMATNDLLSCDRFLSFTKARLQQQRPTEKAAIDGDFRYIIRMQAGHLREGIKLIEEVKSSVELKTILMKCLPRTQSAFSRLEESLEGGSDAGDFKKKVKEVRDNVGFHYNDRDQSNRILNAITSRLKNRAEAPFLSFTMPKETRIDLFRYSFADEIFDTFLDSDIFKVNPVDSEVVNALTFQTDLANEFVVFAVDYIYAFMEQRGLLRK